MAGLSPSTPPAVTRGNPWPFLVLLVFAFLVRLVFFTGYNPGDTLTYASVTRSLLEGTYRPGSVLHALRMGLLLPSAGVGGLFGINPVTMSVFPILCSLGSVGLTGLLGTRFWNRNTGLLAGFLMALFPMDVFWATQFMPDACLCFFSSLSVGLFLVANTEARPGWRRILLVLSGLALGWAYLIKEVGVMTGLALVGYIFFRRRIRWDELLVPLGFLLVLIPELAYYHLSVGDPFFRSRVAGATNRSVTSTRFYSGDLLAYPYYFFVSVYQTGVHYYLFTAALVYAVWSRVRLRGAPGRWVWVVLIWWGALFLYFEFGLMTLNPPRLVHRDLRYLHMVAVPVCLLGGWFLLSLGRGKRVLLLAGVSVISLAVNWFTSGMERNHTYNSREIARTLAGTDPLVPVYANFKTVLTLRYFLSFREDDRLRFLTHRDYVHRKITLVEDPGALRDGYVVLDWELMQGEGFFQDSDIPEVLRELPPDWQVVRRIEKPQEGVLRVMGWIRDLARSGWVPEAVGGKIGRTAENLLRSRPAVVYRVKPGEDRSDP